MKLQDKRSNIRKPARVIRMSDRAYVLFRKMADKRDLGVGDYFEVLAREEAARSLSEAERAQADSEAQEIIETRKQQLGELERSGAV